MDAFALTVNLLVSLSAVFFFFSLLSLYVCFCLSVCLSVSAWWYCRMPFYETTLLPNLFSCFFTHALNLTWNIYIGPISDRRTPHKENLKENISFQNYQFDYRDFSFQLSSRSFHDSYNSQFLFVSVVNVFPIMRRSNPWIRVASRNITFSDTTPCNSPTFREVVRRSSHVV